MKKFLSLALVLVMIVCCFAACGDGNQTNDPTESNAEAAKGTVIELGNSGLTITSEKKYVKGDISSEDTDENQVAYYKSEETLVDFDVYEWVKATGENLASAIAEEAEDYDNAEVKEAEINGFKLAYYNATEESEGKEYKTVTYMIDNGDEFVEIVFWLDGDNAEAEVDAMINSLAKSDDTTAAAGGTITLGNSGLKIANTKKFVKGDISTEDTDENQVAYYKSEETLVDFDVYEWAKATDETLAAAIAEESEDYDNAEVKETEINGIKAAYYNATEESEGKEYKTVTYMIDNGDEFVEIVFWLDGDNAEAEVNAIMATLAK